ncbi:hypothetical protein [Mycobacteroides chelonae]|uniref:hypothetical protein n=1 Tax=Mycobacteroides chelonae TaxID=1774 RepID=UPI0010427914|nr:hypothetical protein [Mycobacteroides chelonae]
MDGNDWGATASLNGSIQVMSETIATQQTTIQFLSSRLDKAKDVLGDIVIVLDGHGRVLFGGKVDPVVHAKAVANRGLEELRA